MNFNTLTSNPASRTMINQFGGYNHNLRIADNEFYDMQNMCYDDYPAISSSFGDYVRSTDFGESHNIASFKVIKNSSIWAAEDENGKVTTETLTEDVIYVLQKSLASEDGPHYFKRYADSKKNSKREQELGKIAGKLGKSHIVVMGSQVVLYAEINDSMQIHIYNTATAEFEEIKGKIDLEPSKDKPVSFEFCNSAGVPYEHSPVLSAGVVAEVQALPKDNNGLPIDDGTQCLLNKGDGEYELYVYSTQYSGWFIDNDTYIKISYTDISKQLKADDTLYISGVRYTTTSEGADAPTIRTFKDKLNGMQRIYAVNTDDDYVLIKGIAASCGEYTQTAGTVTFDKKVPLMDFVVEHNNRIWGCRYGKNAAGDIVNEIYASALGNPASWITYDTTSIAAYTVSLGSSGAFTGATIFGGYPIFLKENYIHRIYGTQPSNYQLSTTQCRGVQKGSEKSLQTIGGLLYYKSPVDVSVYDGTLPISISQNFGNEQLNYKLAVAATEEEKYYITCNTPYGNKMFIYDTLKGLWRKHAAPDNELIHSIEFNGKVHLLDKDGEIKPDEDSVTWYVESGLMGMEYADFKYINRIDIRMQLQPEGVVSVLIEYDSSGEWEHAGTVKGLSLKTFTIPIKPRRCDHFRMRIEGQGKVKIFSISKLVKGVK